MSQLFERRSLREEAHCEDSIVEQTAISSTIWERLVNWWFRAPVAAIGGSDVKASCYELERDAQVLWSE